jgi:ArsR family transcriptional regulator
MPKKNRRATSHRAGQLSRAPNGVIYRVKYSTIIEKVEEDNWVDRQPYFCKYRNMESGASKKRAERVAKYAAMFSAMGTEPRLRIMQLLLSAHPEGLVVGDVQRELEIPNSTLSHHLDKLKNEELVHVQRESTFLRYTANTQALQELLQFLYSECCTRNKALKPQDIVEICK